MIGSENMSELTQREKDLGYCEEAQTYCSVAEERYKQGWNDCMNDDGVPAQLLDMGYAKGKEDTIYKMKSELIDIILGNEEFIDWQKEKICLCLECAIDNLKEKKND